MTFKDNSSWVILNSIEQHIKQKIELNGKPLRELGVSINYGIKTGCNEAFIIDTEKKDELISQDPKSAEIIRPILRGKDIKRYHYDYADLYLIIAKYGSYRYLEKDYPAVYKHLQQYKTALENRGQCRYTSSRKIKTGSDYIGQHHWLELDNNPSDTYLDDFSKQKIAWGNLCLEPKFTIVEENMFVSAPSPVIVPGTKVLLAILNSKIANWYIKNLGVTRNGGYFEYKPMFVEKLPIPEIPQKTKKILDDLINDIQAKAKSDSNYETLQNEVDKIICRCYNLTDKEIEFIESV